MHLTPIILLIGLLPNPNVHGSIRLLDHPLGSEVKFVLENRGSQAIPYYRPLPGISIGLIPISRAKHQTGPRSISGPAPDTALIERMQPHQSKAFMWPMETLLLHNPDVSDGYVRLYYSDSGPILLFATDDMHPLLIGETWGSGVYFLKDGKLSRQATPSFLNQDFPGLFRHKMILIPSVRRDGAVDLRLDSMPNGKRRPIGHIKDLEGLVDIDSKERLGSFLDLISGERTHFLFGGNRYCHFEKVYGHRDWETVSMSNGVYRVARLATDRATGKTVKLVEDIHRNGKYRLVKALKEKDLGQFSTFGEIKYLHE